MRAAYELEFFMRTFKLSDLWTDCPQWTVILMFIIIVDSHPPPIWHICVCASTYENLR